MIPWVSSKVISMLHCRTKRSLHSSQAILRLLHASSKLWQSDTQHFNRSMFIVVCETLAWPKGMLSASDRDVSRLTIRCHEIIAPATSNVAQLKGLTSLDLSESSIPLLCTDYLGQLANLKCLILSRCKGVTGAHLTHLSKLHQLQELDASKLSEVSRIRFLPV